MAELFGVVAGGIGAVSLAIQIIEKTYQLNTMLKSSKDIPQEVQDKLLVMELFANTLHFMGEIYRKGPQTSTTTVAAKVIELCKTIAADLTSMVNELEAPCSTGRIKAYSWKSIRAVLRKNRIDQVTLRMQQAISPLKLWFQVYTHNSQSIMLETILDHTARLSLSGAASITQQPSNSLTLSPSKPHFAQAPLSQLGRVKWTSIDSYWVVTGSLTISSGRLQLPQRYRHQAALIRRKDEDHVWNLRFHPASWFGHRVYIVSAWLSFGNWQYKMVSYNLRDPDEAIFIACQNRDVDTVRVLLKEGLASPFDLTPNGLTPLHIAALVASSEICQLLIENGADGNFVASPGDGTPLMSLAIQAHKHDKGTDSHEQTDLVKFRSFDHSFLGPRATTRDILDTVRVLVEKGQSDPMIGTWAKPSVLFGWDGPSEPFLWLLRQDHIDVDLEGPTDNSGRTFFHSKANFFSPSSSMLILDALFEEKNYHELMGARDDYGATVLHLALEAWSNYVYRIDTRRVRSEVALSEVAWRYTLVQKLLNTGSDIHAQDYRRSTPLDVVFRVFIRAWQGRKDSGHEYFEKLWRSVVDPWLTALINAGYDLRKYAETEQSLRPSGILQDYYHRNDIGWMEFGIHIKFSYGEDPNDVDIDWEWYDGKIGQPSYIFEDESSQETEEPLPMPGSWQ